MFKNKILIFIILMIALLSIGIASAEESSMNATDTVSLDYDDSSTEVVTSAYDGNTSLDVVSEDNSQLQCENNSETFSRDVKTFNDFSNENTIDDLKSSNYNDDNGVVSLNELNVVSTMDNRANMSDVETAGFSNVCDWSNIIYVDAKNGQDNNDVYDGSSWTTAFKTIEYAFSKVIDNTIIYLSEDTHVVNAEIQVNNIVAVVGQFGTVITNNNGNRVFKITSSTFVIDNCIFENITTTTSHLGTAIINSGKNSTVTNCAFINNTNTFGGAIYNEQGSLTVSDSKFVNNHASAGVDIFNIATINLINNDYSDIVSGTNIYNGGTSGKISSLVNITVLGNKTSTVNYRDGNNVVLSAIITADGASVANGKLTFIVNNQQVDESITSDNNGIYTFTYGGISAVGDYVVSASYNNGDADNTTVNTAVIDVTSYVYVNATGGSNSNSGSSWDTPYATIEHALNNVLSGGIIYLSNGTHSVSNQIDVNNDVVISGQSGTIITNDKINKNRVFNIASTVNNFVIAHCTFENITTSQYGTAIVNSGKNSTVTDCSFINNSAIKGGAIYNVGTINVCNSKFVNNSASSIGVDIFNGGSASTINLTNNLYSDVVDKTNIYMDNGKIISPVVITVLDNETVYGEYGDKILISAEIVADGASVNGGTLSFIVGDKTLDAIINDDGIYTYENYEPDAGENVVSAVYSNCNMTAATIETAGLNISKANVTIDVEFPEGILIDTANTIKVTVSPDTAAGGVTITLNNKTYEPESSEGNVFTFVTDKLAAGVYELVVNYTGDDNYNANITTLMLPVGVVYVNATGGSDSNSGSSWDTPYATIGYAVSKISDGSIIYLSNGTHIVSTQISINKAIAIVGQSGTIITNDKTSKNRVFNIAATVNNFEITHCTFENITTTQYGTAIVNSGKNSTVNDCSFINNSAINGGAIYNVGTITVCNSKFVNNSASLGVDIFNDGKSSTINLTNNIYSDVVDKTNIYMNNGKIISPVVITVLENKTVYGVYGDEILMSAEIVADGASVNGGTLKFIVGGETLDATINNDGIYTYENYEPDAGENVVSAVYSNCNMTAATIETAGLNISKANVTIDVEFPDVILINTGNEIKVTVSPATATGGVTITLNNKTYELESSEGNVFTFTTEELARGIYELVVNYTGDNNYNANITTLMLPVGVVYVDPNGDDNNNGYSWDTAFKTIGYAVSKVGDGGIIYLSNGTHKVASQISINKAVTVVGQSGTVITDDDADDGKCVFGITADNVEVVNCTFANITAPNTKGGAIYNTGKNVTVNNCNFINITSRNDGGIIYNKGNLTVVDSKFANSDANNCFDIYNEATINLTKNVYSSIVGKTNVYNAGKIISPVVITVLGNTTVNYAYGEEVTLNATIDTVDGASVNDVTAGALKFKFLINSWTPVATSNGDGSYSFAYTPSAGEKVVSAIYANADDVVVKTGILNVSKENVTIDVTLPDIIKINENNEIIISLTPSAATGDVTITVNNKNYTVTVEDGVAKFTDVNLDRGVYEVVVNYSGDNNYNANMTTFMLPVGVVYVDPNGDDTNNGYSWDTAFETIGYAVSKVGDGGIIYLSNGTHKVASQIVVSKDIAVVGQSGTVITDDDADDGKCLFVTTGNVEVVNCTFANITAPNTKGGAIYNAGKNVTVNNCNFINITTKNTGAVIYNALGNLTVVDSKFVNSDVNNCFDIYNEATINLTNNVYSDIVDNTNVYNIGKIISPVVITVLGNTTVNCKYGEEVTLNATIDTVDGASVNDVTADALKLKFLINSWTPVAISNGDGSYSFAYTPSAGEKVVSAIYANADDVVVKTGILNVSKENVTIDVTLPDIIKINENNEITISLTPSAATGDVTITVNNKNYTVKVEDGKAKFTDVNLDRGVYEAVVNYSGDNNYNANMTTFMLPVGVVYVDPNGDDTNNGYSWDTAFETIEYAVSKVGDGAIIYLSNGTHKVASQISINKAVTIVGQSGTVITDADEDDGKCVFGISANNVEVVNCTFANITAPNTKGGAIYNAGENVIVNNCTFINITPNGGGSVIYNANGNLDVVDSKFVNSDANNCFDIYNGATINLTNNVYSSIAGKTNVYNNGKIISPVIINVSGNTTIYATIHNSVTLNATITTVDGASVTSDIKLMVGNDEIITYASANGIYRAPYTVMEAATYKIITVKYGTGKLDDATVLTSILDTRIEPDVNVVIDDITYDNDLIVKMDINSDATGTVTITIKDNDGTVVNTYNVDVSDVENYVVPYKLMPGSYTADIKYNGDVQYAFYSTSVDFSISKIFDYNVFSKIDDIKVGDDAVIIISVPETATGSVSTKINGKEYNATINKGVAIINGISGLSAGTYNIDITYSGDDIYVSKTIKDNFTVSKISDYTINVFGPATIEVGQNANLDIFISEISADGKLIITVNGNKQEVDVVGGMASVVLKDLTYGNHSIVVNYTGNDKFESKLCIYSINVTKIAKYNMNVTADPIYVGDDAVIEVYVPADADGGIIVTVDDSEQGYVADIKDGVAKVTISGLGNGTHTIIATFNGDDKYAKFSNKTSIVVSKVSDYAINVTTKDIEVGDDAVIEVHVPEDAKGNITINVGNGAYTVNIVNGVAKVNVSDLANGTYVITATFNGDDKYLGSSNESSIRVSKVVEYDMTVIVPGDVKVGDQPDVNVILPDDADGKVTVKVNGKEYNVTVKDGLASVTVDAFTKADDYEITATYNGDNKYASRNVTGVIMPVSGVDDYDMNVTIPEDIKVGDKFTITVNLPKDATGDVNVTVGGADYIAEVKNGVVNVNVSAILSSGSQVITVTYNGNDKYSKSNMTSSIVVSKVSDYNMNITVPNDPKVGDNVEIKVNVPADAKGSIIIYIGGIGYNTTVVDGVSSIILNNLTAGSHTIVAEYTGDNRYVYNFATGNITLSKVAKYNMNVTADPIYVGDDAVIEVHVPADAVGGIVVTVDDSEQGYVADIKDGVAIVTISGLDDGIHTFTATFNGDDKYAKFSNKTSILVSKVSDYSMDITTKNIRVGEDAIIKVTVPEDAKGTITIHIADKDHTVNIANGVAEFTVSDLANGTYLITATYNGDDKYLGSSNKSSISVSKVTGYELVIAANSIKVGENASIFVFVPEDVVGRIVINIDGNEVGYAANITAGVAEFNIPNLTNGTHTIVATFDGNNKYDVNKTTGEITVFKVSEYNMDIVVRGDVKVGDNATIDVNLPSDAYGNITIKVNNKEYNTTVKGGLATIITDVFTQAGDYRITAIYNGNDKYTEGDANNILKVARADSKLNIVIGNVVYDDVFAIGVTLTGVNNAMLNGTVVVTINGQSYNVSVKNGEGSIDGVSLDANDYYFIAKWDGDDNYNSAENNGSFNVAKANSKLTVTIESVDYGEIFKINAALTGGDTPLNGFVTVIVNGEEYIVHVENGGGVANGIKLPAASAYVFTAMWEGNTNYNNAKDNGSFAVNKINSAFNVNVTDIYVGENETVKFSLPSDATGTVTIKIGDDTYQVSVEDGMKVIRDLKAGNYTAIVTYNGDNNYNNVTGEYNFTVSKNNPDMNISIANFVFGDGELLNISLPGDANGDAIIFIDNAEYSTVKIISGKANEVITGLSAGNHTIVVNYKGDGKYTEFNATTVVKVARADSKLNVTIGNVVYDGVFTINANLTGVNNAPLNGNVVITVNGQTYTVNVKDGVVNSSGISLDANDYYFTAKWEGNGNYTGAETNGSFNVAKADSKLNVGIESVNYGEIFKINATLTGVEDTPLNGFVTVMVNGEEYIVQVKNGEGVANGIKLPAASAYVFTAVWEGNANYNSVKDEGSFAVNKINPTFDAIVSNIYVGENETIRFNLPVDATGNITIKIANGTYEMLVEEGMKVISDLEAGNYTAIVTYNGDNNYNNLTKEYNFTVSKNEPDMFIIKYSELDYGVDYDILINLDEDATGEVSAIINGTFYPVEMKNGFGYVRIPILDVGKYNYTVTFNGDDKYIGAIIEGSFIVLPVDPTLKVVIDNVEYGKNLNIIATLTGVNNTALNGTVDVTINKDVYHINVSGGRGIFNNLKLVAGDYNFTATWIGNNNYNQVYDNGSFKIAKIDPTFDADVSNIYVDDNEIIKFTLPSDATGNVTVKIGDESYNISVNYGEIIIPAFKKEGNYTAIVTYNGDNNYNNVTKEYNFTVSKITLNEDMRVIINNMGFGGSGIINIFTPSDATGDVNIIVDGESYSTVTLNKGQANGTISGLAAGNHIVDIEYLGNDKYTNSTVTKNIDVSKANPTLMIIIRDVNYGDEFEITATLLGVQNTLNGTVYVIVDNKIYNMSVIDGAAIVKGTKLAAGNYTAVAYWQGNANYTSVNKEIKFIVSKINSTLDVNVNNIYVGENETIKFNLPEDATGTVNITIGDDTYIVPVTDAMKTIANLKAGNYTATITYSGDNNYNSITKEFNFNVSKIKPDSRVIFCNTIDYGSDYDIIFDLPYDATGNVSVILNGTTYLVEMNNGFGSLSIPMLDAGHYIFNATYSGDDKYLNTKSVSIEFNVLPVDPNLKVIIDNIEYGKNSTIIATLTGVNNTSLNGTVEVTIGKETYNITVTDGKGILNNLEFLAGDYNFTATWEGTNNYNPAQDTGSFKIARSNPAFNVDVPNIFVDEDEIIKFNLPTDATGNVTIQVGNYSNTVPVTEGMDIIANLKAGNYTAIITYSGDDNYNSLTKEFNFTVSKNYPAGDILWNNITYGSGNGLIAIFSIDAKGTITFNINGTPHILELNEGYVYFDVSNMDAGSYAFNATYSGDDKYRGVTFSNITFNVLQANPNLNVIVDSVEYGKNSTIIATLTGVNNTPLNGTVVVTINNKTYNVSVVDGNGILKDINISAGDYNFTAAWEGTNNYNSAQYTGSFKIAKIDPTIDVSSEDIFVGDDEVITVLLPEDATGEVVITVNEINYTAKVENGIARQNITGLKTMNETSITYLVHVKYLGDNNYNNITALDDEFTVYKVVDYEMNITIPTDVKIGENTTISVDVPGDATGNITVCVDGENYTANVENGTANVTISPLPLGQHNITIIYSGDDKYDPISKQGNITVSSNDVNLIVDDVVMFYHDGTRLVAKLLDSLGNPLANATLTFVINGNEYNRTTDVNGSASIALNLISGNYNTTVIYWGNESYNKSSVNATVTINPSIISQDIVKMYQNDTQFYAKFLNSQGNPLANATVTFNINGVFYTRQTDENGTTKLSINLRPGNYTLTAYNPETGEQLGFNVLVKSLIEASDLTKYYNNESRFQAKIYNKDGSLAVNKSVTFNINGVFYTRQTDENGTVKLAINLRPGDYIITTMFEGLEISNNVKVLQTLITSDLTMSYRDGSRFNATLLDGQGNPLANQTVRFNVNGVFYNKISDENGVASLNINLQRGEYIITSIWEEYSLGNTISIS